jgi:hypothetical protein
MVRDGVSSEVLILCAERKYCCRETKRSQEGKSNEPFHSPPCVSQQPQRCPSPTVSSSSLLCWETLALLLLPG